MNIGGSIFIFGHSLADNDAHIFREIVRNTKIKSIFVSLHGAENSEANLGIKRKANLLATQRAARASTKPLMVHFFDADSAHVWG